MVEIKQKRIFNPSEESKELLIDTFAIRKEAFSRIMKFVNATSLSLQHCLIIGQRGMGKTTLMLRIKYEIEDSVELSKRIIPIRFSEEQYNLSSLPDVWEEIGLFLEKGDKSLAGLVDRMINLEKYDDFERLMFDEIVMVLKQKNKRILLLIDNIGDLFNKLSDLENKRLREILMTTDHIQLIGASTHMLEHTFSYDKPFFEFFSEVKLDPLTKDEAKDLMISLAQHYQTDEKIKAVLNESPERIEVFRRISGGVPRTMILLFEILLDVNEGGVFKDLELLLDRVGDWYKHRLDSLKPQQQKIMDAIARAWEPVSSGEVLKLSRLSRDGMASNQISAQLKQMEQSQLIASKGEKRKLYFIPERFFNIWYLMRHGRQNSKEKILWLIKFIENWCISSNDLIELTGKHIHALRRGNYEHQAAYYKTLALSVQPGLSSELKNELFENAYAYLAKSGTQSWAEDFKPYKISEPDPEFYTKSAKQAIEAGDIFKAESLMMLALEKNEKDAEFRLGVLFHLHSQELDKAKQYYLKAIEKGDGKAMYNLAILFIEKRGDKEKAEQYFLMAIEKGHVGALNNLANLYLNDSNDIEKAEQYYLKAVEKGNIDAMFNLAFFYKDKIGDNVKAEQYYLLAIEKGDTEAMNNLANLYKNEMKNIEKAKQFYLKAVEKGSVEAMFNLANLYLIDSNDIQKAELYYLMAIKNGDVGSLNNLANLYKNEIKDLEKAEQYYLMAVEKGNVEAIFNLAVYYKEERRDQQKAEQYYLLAIEHGYDRALNNLALLYDEEMNEKEKAEQYYLMAIEKGDQLAFFNYVYLLIEKFELKKALAYSEELFQNDTFYEQTDFLEMGTSLIIKLIKIKQSNFLLKLFNDEDSKFNLHFRPLYFVLAYFMKDDLPGEYEKAGAEIKETVDEIISMIELK